jgi:hypothetical protein
MSTSTSKHWGAAVADTLLAREAADSERAAIRARLRSERDQAITTEGAAFMERVDGSVSGAATAFNARIGIPVLATDRLPSGAVSIRHRDGAFVLFAPDLTVSDGVQPWLDNEPGVSVTTRESGRESRTAHPFLVHNGRLHVDYHGAVMVAEAFVRAVLEHWLQRLPLGGR